MQSAAVYELWAVAVGLRVDDESCVRKASIPEKGWFVGGKPAAANPQTGIGATDRTATSN